jgi:hypothetical protein
MPGDPCHTTVRTGPYTATRGLGYYKPYYSPALDVRPVPRELPDDDGLFSIVARGPYDGPSK